MIALTEIIITSFCCYCNNLKQILKSSLLSLKAAIKKSIKRIIVVVNFFIIQLFEIRKKFIFSICL